MQLANIPYVSDGHYAVAFSAHAVTHNDPVTLDANALDVPGVQGAQHEDANKTTVPSHAECIRIMAKLCREERLTRPE
jgi:hypothetical protein